MPQLEQLWNQYKDKGLHIFHVEKQGTTKEDLIKFCKEKRLTFPQTIGGDFDKYTSPGGLPYAFVVGVDGKVIWEGRSGYKGVVHQEIKKVLYPGLGKREVARSLRKAAAEFARQRFAKAYSKAESELEKAEKDSDSEVIAEAKYIMERVNKLGSARKAMAVNAENEREFGTAYISYRMLSKQFKGMPLGDEMKAAYKRLDDDKELKREVKAALAFDKLLESQVNIYKPSVKKQQLLAFAKKFEGTRAAEKATEEANSIN